MTETQTATQITYQGEPVLAFALAQVLEEEGVTVESVARIEQRSVTSMVEAVTVGLFLWGSQVAITAAVNKFRKRFPGDKGSVTIEPDDGDDDD